MVGKGQPPKAPEDKKTRLEIFLSQTQRQEIEQARAIEAPEKRFGAYVRDAAMEHVEHVLNVKAIDDVFNAHNMGGRQLKNNENKE